MENRPIIDVKISSTDKPLAVFTHISLRPILKQQHTILCALIRNDKKLDTREITKFSEAKNTILLKQFMQKNTELRSMLVGAIIGCFSEEELAFYLKNQKETRRRMIEMTVTRFLSEFEMN